MRFFSVALYFFILSMPMNCPAWANISDQENLKAEEVLVIANSASSDSMSVAQHYMARRAIPEENLFTINFPNSQHHRPISHKDFQGKIVKPLKQFLEKKGLKEKILAFVTVYDVPYKVASPTPLPLKLRKKLEKKRVKLEQLRFDSTEIHPDVMQLKETIAALEAQLQQVERVWAKLTTKLPKNQKKRARQIFNGLASVDSELAWLYRKDVYGERSSEASRIRAYLGRSKNIYFSQKLKFRAFRKALKSRGLLEKRGFFYLTARLEGPTVEISKALVDLAMQAEKEGPSGIGCFDAKGRTIGKQKTGYDLGEAWVRRAYLETLNAGFRVKLNEEKVLFKKGACPSPLFYWGWYALTKYRDSFGGHFSPGAFAVHTASGEARNIRRFNEGGRNPWCAGFLAHGVAFCSGPIAEPFLDAFPHADIFYPKIFKGWSAGEAYWASKSYSSWMMVMIGDPLYAPFSGNNTLKNYVTGLIYFTQNGSSSGSTTLKKNQRYDVELLLKASSSIFRDGAQYPMLGYETNRKNAFNLSGSENLDFEVLDRGTLLILRGLELKIGDTGNLKQGELAVTIDLKLDGGKKIISQVFRLDSK